MQTASPIRVLGAALVIAACYQVHRGDCTFRCGMGDACPSGQQCHDGWCTSDLRTSCASDAAPTADADPDVAVDSATETQTGSDGNRGQDGDVSDGAGDACDGSCHFSLLDLPGLVLWLQPGNFVTDSATRILRWTDASPFANHADQDTFANRPLAVLAGNGRVNSVAAFDSTGKWLQIADSESLNLAADDFVFAAVVSISSTATIAGGCIYRKQNSDDSPYVGLSVWASFPSVAGLPTSFAGMLSNRVAVATVGSYDDDGLHAVVFLRHGTVIVLRIDGSEQLIASGVPLVDLSTTEPSFIGAHGNGPSVDPHVQPLQGSLAEMVIVRGRADPALVGAIEHDLASRHPAIHLGGAAEPSSW